MRREYVKYLEKELKIENEMGWKEVKTSDLIGIKLPPNWKLRDVLTLVSETLQSPKIRTASYKKSQSILKSMFPTLFPEHGFSIKLYKGFIFFSRIFRGI